MVAGDKFDFDVRVGLGEVGNRQLGGGNRTGAADIGIKTRHVAEHADLHIDLLSVGPAAGERRGERRKP